MSRRIAQKKSLTLEPAPAATLFVMATCCCPAPADHHDGMAACPGCGSTGSRVETITVKALLTPAALVRFRPVEHRFCADPACEVVYFTADEAYRRADIRVPVWQKEPVGARLICYCFGETEAIIRKEVDLRGVSHAVDRVREHIAAKRCACEVRNPRGACCLADVMAAVARAEQSRPAQEEVIG